MSVQGLGNSPVIRPTIADVQRAVCERKGLTLKDMRAGSRKHCLAHPRQVAMALARELCGKSLPQIGRMFGRDHTTVLYAVRKVARAAEVNPELEIGLAQYRERIAELVVARMTHLTAPILDEEAWQALGGERAA